MITKKGWNRSLALSLFTKEATYDAGVTLNSTNACLMSGFEADQVQWDDKLQTDKDYVTGLEHGYDQEIIQYGAKLSYKEPRAKPNTIAGLAALVLGSFTPTKDSSYTAYRHRIIPVAAGTALPSIQIDELFGGLQYTYTGVKGNSMKISSNDGVISVEAELIGSGTRATSSATFPAKITESWLKLSNSSIWIESGANISIDAPPAQGAESISSATPDDLSPRLQSFEFGWDNKLTLQAGCGSNGAALDADYGRRSATLKGTFLFDSSTELAYYAAQDAIALEIDIKGGLIAVGGSMYYGVQLIFPRLKIKMAPTPKGGVNDDLTCDLDFEVLENGTNPPVIIDVYNAQAAYLA